MAHLGWARCTDRIADTLRRGAWYPIVEAVGEESVVVAVANRRIRLSLHDVRVRQEEPKRWSIVVRTGVLRPTLGGQGRDLVTTYAVCPKCSERQDFTGRPHDLKCDRCNVTSEVGWTGLW